MLYASAGSLLSHLATLQPPTEPADTANFIELCSCSDGSGRVAVRQMHLHGRLDALADARFEEGETQDALMSFYHGQRPEMIILVSCGNDGYFHQIASAQRRNGRHFWQSSKTLVPQSSGKTSNVMREFYTQAQETLTFSRHRTKY